MQKQIELCYGGVVNDLLNDLCFKYRSDPNTIISALVIIASRNIFPAKDHNDILNLDEELNALAPNMAAGFSVREQKKL